MAFFRRLAHNYQVAITCRETASTAFASIVRQVQLDLSMPNVWTVDAMGLELQAGGFLALSCSPQEGLKKEHVHLCRVRTDT